MDRAITTNVVTDVNRIVVLRANALGDLVFTLPALEALSLAYPDAEIVLLAREWHRELLAVRPGPVDRVVPVPAFEDTLGPEDHQELDKVITAMAAEGVDLALQLHGGGANSNPLVCRLDARVSAGLQDTGAETLDRNVPYVVYQSEVERLLEVVATVGAVPLNRQPHFPVIESDRAEAGAIVPVGGPLAVLHPGASDPRRRWPGERFAAVGDALAQAGASVVVTGTAAEVLLVQEVVDAMRRPATPLAGALSIGGLAGLLAGAGVVVSNDTGPLHLAAAVGTPTVGIFWCGNLINAGPTTRSRHRPAISWVLDCPVCATNCITGSCGHTGSFVVGVDAEEVCTSALDLLNC
ncbi:MAG: glycosyltransferase family 9 protein [Acidimicrobiales bacterium]